MGVMLAKLSASGITVAALPDGRLRVTGALTDALRASIRDHKATIMAELGAREPAAPGVASALIKREETADELRELVGIVSADWPDDERADVMAAALADPEAALVCFRALVAERGGALVNNKQITTPAGTRACVDCANFTASGRCLAAWRGESLGAGIATSRTWTPAVPDRPQRCGAYAPGPNDPDRRAGRERWPWLF